MLVFVRKLRYHTMPPRHKSSGPMVAIVRRTLLIGALTIVGSWTTRRLLRTRSSPELAVSEHAYLTDSGIYVVDEQGRYMLGHV